LKYELIYLRIHDLSSGKLLHNFGKLMSPSLIAISSSYNRCDQLTYRNYLVLQLAV